MAAKVFISYRRDDSAGHAGRVHDRLEREFGRDLVFMDVDAIPLGADFAEVLSAEVAECDVLLAIIGSSWLDARDEHGHRRLETEHDFVRIEIAAALKRRIAVIPILLDGARMPTAEQLPSEIKSLAHRNALDVRHASFHADVDRLIRGLRSLSVRATPYPTTEGSIKGEHRMASIGQRLIYGQPEDDPPELRRRAEARLAETRRRMDALLAKHPKPKGKA
jgi:hypothetical protein